MRQLSPHARRLLLPSHVIQPLFYSRHPCLLSFFLSFLRFCVRFLSFIILRAVLCFGLSSLFLSCPALSLVTFHFDLSYLICKQSCLVLSCIPFLFSISFSRHFKLSLMNSPFPPSLPTPLPSLPFPSKRVSFHLLKKTKPVHFKPSSQPEPKMKSRVNK